ncbi:MAG TPA: type II toxin-antitoxin system RelE/ParE family toxin [Verrucomicrobiales bacterium]|jgi:toxin ParE1/3/4|nr:type II toxin-antitoxin system RelE/ParE family toxin [Verrucomicrobiales bacterium]HIL70913.1 type II toxin-antitoxin system RelE/ParE family toxin [Verrucomicrobiota bacterium]
MARISRHPLVQEKDLPQIYAFIAGDNPDAAVRVLDAIDKTFELIGHSPYIGPLYSIEIPVLGGLRMIPVLGYPRYLVFYHPVVDEVRILYVFHGMRNISERIFGDNRM